MVKHFERDETLVLHVLGEIHGRHSAPAKLAVDAVRARERLFEMLDRKGGHRYIACAMALNRGVSLSGSRSESCSIHSLCPNPLSTARSRADRPSSIFPRFEYVHATLYRSIGSSGSIVSDRSAYSTARSVSPSFACIPAPRLQARASSGFSSSRS